jgi:hypothetical protein
VSRCPHRLELLVEEVCAWLIIITLVVVASLVFWNLHHSKHHRPAPYFWGAAASSEGAR